MQAYIAFIRFVVVTLGVAVVWLFASPRIPIQQPLDFDHAKHAPMTCVACHQGVETAARAGYPADAVCLECHNTPPRARGGDAVWPKTRTAPRIAWARVNRVPKHTYFSHRRHVVLANLECASCHGEVGKRSTPPGAPATRLSMAACESCHARENANNDCAACHL
jgi:hypothetical protein